MSTSPAPTSTTELAITTIDRSPESHITRLHRAVIGPISADYYLSVLARLDTREQAIPIWNWAACLCTFNWMVFRGLWTPALCYVGTVLAVVLAMLGFTQLATVMADSIQWSLWAGILTLALLVPGFFGNAWLYTVYRKRLASALSGTASVRDACMMLHRQASSRPRLVWIVVANLALAGLLLALWLSLPAPHRQVQLDGAVAPQAQRTASATSGPAALDTPGAAMANGASGSVAVAAPVSAAAQEATPPAAMASVASVAAPSAPDSAPPMPEMRRSTRFAAAPRTTAASPTRAAASDAPPAKPTATPTGRFLVNVGLFAQGDNARRAHSRLRDAGLPATMQALERPSGTLTRVRVGPFATRAEADDAAQKIRALRLDAVVTRQ